MTKLTFKVNNSYSNILKQILDKISKDEYTWILDEEEVHYRENYLFQKLKYNNTEFQELISKDEYYTIFINLKLYEEYDNKAITTYNDFLKSKCILLMLITDNTFVEIYVKDTKIKKQIMDNIEKYHFQDFKEINNNDDQRQILWVNYKK